MMPNQQNGMDPQDQRNFLIAMALMIVFVFGYQYMFVAPAQQKAEAARAEAAAAAPQVIPGTASTALEAPLVPVTVAEALTKADRVEFDADRVDGSIRLQGAVIDDLNLKDHYKTIDKGEELRLLRPSSAENGYYASWYWLGSDKAYAGLADKWQVAENAVLKTGQPIDLTLEKDGLQIKRRISVDENYLFTYEDTLTNTTAEPIAVTPVGQIRRHGQWKEFLEATDPGSSKKMGLAHQGLIGVLKNGSDQRLKLRGYKGLAKGKGIKGDLDHRTGLDGGWIGLTDMYWMAALIPEQGTTYDAEFALKGRSKEIMEIKTTATQLIIAPGETQTSTNQIFAGAKEYKVVREYKTAGIPRFDDSIDWGNILYYITRPFFALLNWLKTQIGSFGLAILALTLLIKIPLIPLYNASYKSMAKMKKLSEPMKEIQERFKEDPQRRQQEVMKLYQREKANPLAGCIPILFTIPVFFALYKTLYVTIEMRHTPFLFLNDLSAPDPTAIGNLFGLLPWAASDVKAIPIIGIVIGIGILPILYGVTMAAIQALSPPPPDPTQRTIMMALPFVFMFVFGSFAAGLVLYWVWSNILSLIQQYYIMRRNGVETQLDKLIGKLLGRTPKTEE
jgi:YidC/Oxa1 family membrane protein insertase